MRTKNLFRTLVAATLAVVSISAFAQKTTTGSATVVRNTAANVLSTTSPEGIDLVTVGSSMPYNVTGDQTVGALYRTTAGFQASEFNWRVNAVVAGTDDADRTVTNNAGGALAAGTTANYYLDTAIVVDWLTTGIRDIVVSEQTRNTLGLPVCPGGDSTIRVYVLPRPSVEWAEASFTGPQGTAGDRVVGGCAIAVSGSSTNWNIPINLESYSQDMRIAYSYTKYSLSGVAGVPTTQTLLASADYNEGADAFYSANPTTQNAGVVTMLTLTVPDPAVDAAGAYGRWEFTVTAVDDWVSRKSGVVSINADLPGGVAAQTFTVYSLPTPTTGAVKHVTNTGW